MTAPLDPDDPAGAIAAAARRLSNWGRWGDNDVLGTLNFLDDAMRSRAAGLVRRGTAFSLSLRFDADGPRTRTQMPSMTDKRREVLVAMAAGYLRPYPYYDPRPATYQQIADRLGLTKSQVVKRIEQVRLDLVASGVLGLEKEVDARRALCEWLLATRAVSRADLVWLEARRRTDPRDGRGEAHS